MAPDFPCHRTRVETRARPTMEVFFSPREPENRARATRALQQEFTKSKSTATFVSVRVSSPFAVGSLLARVLSISRNFTESRRLDEATKANLFVKYRIRLSLASEAMEKLVESDQLVRMIFQICSMYEHCPTS